MLFVDLEKQTNNPLLFPVFCFCFLITVFCLVFVVIVFLPFPETYRTGLETSGRGRDGIAKASPMVISTDYDITSAGHRL